MVRLLTALILLITAYSGTSQVLDTTFNGYLSPLVITGGSAPTWTFNSRFINANKTFTGAEVGTDCKIIVSSGVQCYQLTLNSVAYSSGNISGSLTDPSGVLTTLPSIGAIVRPTDNRGLLPYVSGVPPNLQSCIEIYNNFILDTISTSELSNVDSLIATLAIVDTTISSVTYTVDLSGVREFRVVTDLTAAASNITVEIPDPSLNLGKKISVKQINPSGSFATQVTVDAIGNRIRLPGQSILTNVLNVPSGTENKYTLTPAYDSNSGTFYWEVDNESITLFELSSDVLSIEDAGGSRSVALPYAKVKEYYKVTTDTSLLIQEKDLQVDINYNLPFIDNLSVPARGVYSFRKVTSSTLYSGPALTVNNSAGDTLQVNFLGNYGSIVDTAAILAFDDTVYIKRWYDQSGFNNHLEVVATAPATGLGPYVVLNGALIKINGKMSARFGQHGANVLSKTSFFSGGRDAIAFATVYQRVSGNYGPFNSNSYSSASGYGLYYYASPPKMTFGGRGYFTTNPPYLVDTVSVVNPTGVQNIISGILSTDRAVFYRDGNLDVTPELSTTGVTTSGPELTLGQNYAFTSSFGTHNHYLQELIVWENDSYADIDLVNQNLIDYYTLNLNADVTSSNITVTIPTPVDSILNKIITVGHLGQEDQSTVVKVVSGSGKFVFNENTLDSLIILSAGNPTVELQVQYKADSMLVWKVINDTRVDQRLLDTISDRADKFIYVSNYATIEEAVDSAISQSRVLVVDQSISTVGDIDLQDLQVFITNGSVLSADSIFASGAMLVNPGVRQIFGSSTNVVGSWSGVGPAYIEWTVGTDTSSYANVARAFRNAHIIGDYIKLESRRYPTNSINCNSTKLVAIRGNGVDASRIIMQGTGNYFYSTSTGSPVDIQDVTIETKAHENKTYNNNTSYRLASVQRSSTNETAYTDISFFRLNRIKALGEVTFKYSIEGSATTYPDSITFADSGIDFVEITNSRFEHVRDFFATANSFFRKAIVSNIEVKNLYGAFFTQSLTLDDSLSRQGYNNSYFKMTDAYFSNDTIVNYTSGGYMGTATLKARSAELENVVIENMIKELGADLHPFGYLSCEFYSVKNCRAINCFDKGDWSPFEFKGARYAEISNCQVLISPEILEQYGIINSSGELISSDYGFSIIDTDDGSIGKSLNMHDCIVDVPIYNVSTGVQDINNFTFTDNVFNINRFTAEPTTTGDNTVPYSIFADHQTASNSDTTRSFISQGNVFSIEDIVGNDNTVNYTYRSSGNSTRVYETVLYDDVWSVDTGKISITLYVTEKFLNKSRINGVGSFSVRPISGTVIDGGEILSAHIELGVEEHLHITNTTLTDRRPIFPHLKNISARYVADRNSSDTVFIYLSNQNDWFLESIGYPFHHLFQLDYVDTFGIKKHEEFFVRFAGSTNVTAYSSGVKTTENWASLSIVVDPVYDSDIRLVAGPSYKLYLTNLANVTAFDLSVQLVDTLSHPRFSGNADYTTGTGGEVRFLHQTKSNTGSFYAFFGTVDSILTIQIDTITPDSIRATVVGAAGPVASGQTFRIRWYYKLVLFPLMFVFLYNEKRKQC